MTANVDDEALSSILLHLKSNPTVEDSDNDNDDNYNYNNHSSTLDERDFKYRESYVDGVNDNNMEVLKRNQQYDDHQNHPSDRLMSSKKTKHDSSNIAFSPEPTGLTTMSSINTITKKLKISELKKYFHLPINNVSKKLGVCTAVIKKICRHNNIQRWPYRQIKSLSCAMQSLEMASLNRSLGDEERKNMRTQIDCLQESIACIIANPSVLNSIGENENVSLPANQLMEIVRQNTSTSVVSTVTSSASAIATEALSSRKHELNSRDRAVTETSIVSDTPSTAAPAPAIMPSKPPGHTILNTEASTGTHASVEGIDLLLTADQGRNTSKNTANITAPTTSINRRPIYRPQQPSYQRSLGRSYVPELGKDSSHFTHSSDRKVIFSTPVTLTPLVRRRFRVIHANMKPPVPLLEPDICDINASSFYTLPSSILSFGSLTRSKGLLYGNTPLISSGMTQNRMIPQLPPISSIRMPSPMYADKEHIGFVGLTPTYAAITTSSYGMNTINHNPLFGPSGPIYESQFSRSPNQSYPQQQLQQQQMQVQQQQQQHQPQAQLYSHEQYYNNNKSISINRNGNTLPAHKYSL